MDASQFLEAHGVDTSKPGFYDSMEFASLERSDPSVLERYADFVDEKQFTEAYLLEARAIIKSASEYLERELREDGRRGACADASMMLSQMLNEFGIWNYVVNGATKISFDRTSGVDDVFFTPITTTDDGSRAAHCWVVAPPFKIVDLTIPYQHYSNGEDRLIGAAILAETVEPGVCELPMLFDSDSRMAFLRMHQRQVNCNDLDLISPGLREKIEKYGVCRVSIPKAIATYAVCGIVAPEPLPIEEARYLVLRGKSPADLLAEFRKQLSAR